MQAGVYTDTETLTYNNNNNKAPFDSHIPLKQRMRLGVAVREGAATGPLFRALLAGSGLLARWL